MDQDKESLIALNIYYENDNSTVLLNKEPVPILLYWNGVDDVLDIIANNETFKEYITDTCFSVKLFPTAKISYVHFTSDNINETYKNNIVNVQDIFDLNDELCMSFIKVIFTQMYVSFLNEKVVCDNFVKDDIISIYKDIQQKYPEKFKKENVINYIKYKLNTELLLNHKNIDIIINVIEKTLSNEH